MSYSYQVNCPKCGSASSNPDVCDSCGALISRIQSRNRESAAEDDFKTQPTQFSQHTTPGRSWSRIILVCALLLGVAIFMLRKSKETDFSSDGSSSVYSVFTENFDTEVVNYKPSPVLVDFHATWCGPCKTLAPRIEQVASENSSRLKVVKVDIDRDPELARRYSVEGVPTLVLLENGREVTRTVGALPVDQLKATFEPYL